MQRRWFLKTIGGIVGAAVLPIRNVLGQFGKIDENTRAILSRCIQKRGSRLVFQNWNELKDVPRTVIRRYVKIEYGRNLKSNLNSYREFSVSVAPFRIVELSPKIDSAISSEIWGIENATSRKIT